MKCHPVYVVIREVSWIDQFSLCPVKGGCTGGVGTQVRSGNGVWKVPGCPQGFLGSRGGRVLARGTRWCCT